MKKSNILKMENNNSTMDNVKLIGSSMETGMIVVKPSNDDKDALSVLRQLDTVLRESRTHLEELLLQEEEEEVKHEKQKKTLGLRRIQGQRFELFLHGRAFDSIVAKMTKKENNNTPDNVKTRIMEYATRQAKRDPRLQSTEYKFANFSMIMSYGDVESQAPHIDLVAPNYQFALILTDHSDGTLFYETPQNNPKNVSTVADLMDLWIQAYGSSVVPKAILQALGDSEQQLGPFLRSFGNVLLVDNNNNSSPQSEKNLTTGSLLSLPGSIVHAGPQAKDFRAVLFFSANPCHHHVAEYHPDTQYSRIFLCGDIVSRLWGKDGIHYKERCFLLKMLAHQMKLSLPSSFQSSHHFPIMGVANFIQTVETIYQQYYPHSKKAAERLISKEIFKMAKYEDRDFRKPFGNEILVEDVSFLQHKISVPNLRTTFEGGDYRVEIYLYQPGTFPTNSSSSSSSSSSAMCKRVALRYPDENNSWEGLDPEHYKLFMKNKEELFDGTNGTLQDTDGQTISCYVVPNDDGKEIHGSFKKSATSNGTKQTKKTKIQSAIPAKNTKKAKKAL